MILQEVRDDSTDNETDDDCEYEIQHNTKLIFHVDRLKANEAIARINASLERLNRGKPGNPYGNGLRGYFKKKP